MMDQTTTTVNGVKLVTRVVSTRCAGSNPTDDEVLAHVQTLRNEYSDTLKGWLIPFCATLVPGFTGEEPTVEEFLREDFDSSRILPQAVLLSYPVIEE